jgi:hypothetical protein
MLYSHTGESTLNAFARTVIADTVVQPMGELPSSTSATTRRADDLSSGSAVAASYEAWYGISLGLA